MKFLAFLNIIMICMVVIMWTRIWVRTKINNGEAKSRAWEVITLLLSFVCAFVCSVIMGFSILMN